MRDIVKSQYVAVASKWIIMPLAGKI